MRENKGEIEAAMKKKISISLRLDTYAHYLQLDYQKNDGRIRKPSDDYLEDIRFEFHPKEEI